MSLIHNYEYDYIERKFFRVFIYILPSHWRRQWCSRAKSAVKVQSAEPAENFDEELDPEAVGTVDRNNNLFNFYKKFMNYLDLNILKDEIFKKD